MLKSVLEAAVEGASVLSLCEMGDRLILEETGKVYKKEKEMKKGTIPVDYNHVGTKKYVFVEAFVFPKFYTLYKTLDMPNKGHTSRSEAFTLLLY